MYAAVLFVRNRYREISGFACRDHYFSINPALHANPFESEPGRHNNRLIGKLLLLRCVMYPICRAVSNYPNILDSEVVPRNTPTTGYTFEGASAIHAVQAISYRCGLKTVYVSEAFRFTSVANTSNRLHRQIGL